MSALGTRATAVAMLLTVITASGLVTVFASRSAGADELGLAAQDDGTGALVYAQTCASCHEPDGRGVPGQFPPLLGNPSAEDAEYVERVVRNGLDGPIEVLGESYDDAMRGFPDLSDDEVAAVVGYVAALATGEAAASDPADAVVEVEPGTIDEGHDLFIGSTRFANGGAACVGCHTAGDVGNLGGWSLGPDLTEIVATFGGEAAVASWMENPPSPTMEPLFADRPLSAEEIADITAFLSDAPSQPKPADPGDGLVLAGAAGFAVLVAGMAVAWRGMRQTYAERLRSKR